MTWPFRRRRHELAEEIQSHLAMAERDRLDRGESPSEAHAHARKEFGNIPLVMDVTREVSGWARLDRLFSDVRIGTRRFCGNPGVTTGSILLLGLAVGVTTAMFTVVDALVLRPLPFREPERLVRLYMGTPNGGSLGVSRAVLRAWRESPAFEAAEGMVLGSSVIDVGGGPIAKSSASVTPGLFALLGVTPIRGRLFDATEAREKPAGVVLVSENLWRTELGADPSIVGRRLTVDNSSVVVTGILPAGFRFPAWNTDVWKPADDDVGVAGRLGTILRIAPRTSLDEALRMATDRAHAADSSTESLTAKTRSLGGLSDAPQRRALQLLATGVLLVFVALSLNVAGLLLTRFNARRREFSLCSALGASRGRLLRQVFIEAGLIGTCGSVAGVGLAWGLVAAAAALLPTAFLQSSLNPLDMDLRALGVAIGSGFLATLGASLVPAIVATRLRVSSSLGSIERGGTESRMAQTLGRSLLIGEIALACSLLLAAALLGRSFLNLAHADLGFDPRGLVAVYVAANRAPRDLAIDINARILALPGVEQVVWSSGGPMTGVSDLHFGDWLTDVPGARPTELEVDGAHVGPDFFRMYGIPLLQGRMFEPGDVSDRVIIGEKLAKTLFPGMSPVGHSIQMGQLMLDIIGVAKETNRPSIDPNADRADLYLPLTSAFLPPTLTLRCGERCPSEGIIRHRVVAASPAVSVVDVRNLAGTYAADLATPRATAALATAFGIVALLAAASGLFAVLSHAVNRRRREFGIRVALGASATRIQLGVLRDGLSVALVGVGAGSGLTWILLRAIGTLQYGVTSTDPLSWGLVLSVLVVTALASSWRPARTAMSIDPATLLREE